MDFAGAVGKLVDAVAFPGCDSSLVVAAGHALEPQLQKIASLRFAEGKHDGAGGWRWNLTTLGMRRLQHFASLSQPVPFFHT